MLMRASRRRSMTGAASSRVSDARLVTWPSETRPSKPCLIVWSAM